MGSVGFEEIIVIVIVAIVVFGGRLPQVARQVAQQYLRLKNQLQQMRDEVVRQLPTEAELLPPEDVSRLPPPPSTPKVPDAVQDPPNTPPPTDSPADLKPHEPGQA